MELIITEKASVARTIASVLNVTERADGYLRGRDTLISWCIGHLVELALPEAYDPKYVRWRYKDLPILPAQWQYNVSEATKKQFGILKSLMNDERVTGIICATDAGREGELIFRLVYEKAGCQKPVRRLWISSMEESAIRDGLRSMKSMSDYDNLYRAALCRSQADWLIGMNATRLYSLLYGPTLHVGRMMTPTLAMLSAREAAISDFKPESFYTVKLDTGRGVVAQSERYADLNDARRLADSCNHNPAVVTRVEHKQRSENAPALYDLTALQRDANKLFGYTAQQTMEYAQGLYEKKLLTYPRTDSTYLTDDMGETAASTAAMLCGKLAFMEGAEFSPDVSRVLDSRQVSDHQAIIPTMELAKADLAALPESERNILTLAGARLLFAAAEPHTYEVVTAVFSCAGGEFTAKGKTVLCMGWKDLERRYRATLKKKPDTDDEENALALDAPPFAEGQSFDRPAVKVTAHDTTPPKQHTEASLLSAMERAGNGDTDPDAERRGLGTPATRAAVIEKLVKSGFVERKGKQLIPTGDGSGLVAILPDVLTSPQLTAEWENTLTQIAKGKADAGGFMRGIEAMARELVQAHPNISDADKARFKEDKPVIGKCPRCGGSVYEGRKNYYCENRDCAFTMWKNDRFFEERKTAFTPKIAAALLKGGKARVKKLYSPKTGKTYDGLVLLADTGGKYVNYRATVLRDRELTQQA